MNRYSPNKDFNQLLNKLESEYGWRVEKTNGCHIKLISSRNNAPVFCSMTPSDWRVFKKVISDCKKADHAFGPLWDAAEKKQKGRGKRKAPRKAVTAPYKWDGFIAANKYRSGGFRLGERITEKESSDG